MRLNLGCFCGVLVCDQFGGLCGAGDPVIKGWCWQWLSQLNFDTDSWTAPQDVRQVGRADAAAVTATQIIDHAKRLRDAGETRTPLYVMDGLPRLAHTIRIPASPPKPSKAGPGRPKGSANTPAARHDVIKKAARHKTPEV